MAELGNDISNKIYEAKVSSLVLVLSRKKLIFVRFHGIFSIYGSYELEF